MLVLPERLTNRDARDALRMLAQALAREPASGVVIDAAGLRQLDTAALAVLLECRRLAQASGRAFSVRDAPLQLQQLARLYGVDALLPMDAVAPAAAAPAVAPAAA